MKRIVMSIALVFALSGSALATGEVAGTKPAKDLCLLDSNKCEGNTRYDIVEKIRRLKVAFKLGEAVYTPEELRHLNNVLEETRDSFDFDNNDFMFDE